DANDQDWPQFTLDDAMVDRLTQTLQPGSETKQDEAARILFAKKRRAVFRSTVELTEADLQSGRTRLTFDRIDDGGTVFVNGQEAGHTRAGRNVETPLTVDATKLLKAGTNSIAVAVDNAGGGPGGLLAPVYLAGQQLRGLPMHWQMSANLPGAAQEWWRPDLDG